jgi:hypothetical protein
VGFFFYLRSENRSRSPIQDIKEKLLFKGTVFLFSRYLWREKYTFAIAQHKHHHSIYEEADANKRRKRYARPLIDLHMKIYRYEGMESWSPGGKTISGKLETRYLDLYLVLFGSFKVKFRR